MRDVRKMQSNNQFGYSWDRLIVEKRDRIIVEGHAKICIDSLVAMSSKGKQVHWSISTCLIGNSLEISKNFLSCKFCWISRDCNGAPHASVKLAGSLRRSFSCNKYNLCAGNADNCRVDCFFIFL